MLDRQHGDIVFQCDGCNEVLETGTGNFSSALNVLRREQWKAVKDQDDWMHFCPQCKAVPGVMY